MRQATKILRRFSPGLLIVLASGCGLVIGIDDFEVTGGGQSSATPEGGSMTTSGTGAGEGGRASQGGSTVTSAGGTGAAGQGGTAQGGTTTTAGSGGTGGQGATGGAGGVCAPVDDNNDCTDDLCVAGMPSHENRPAGAACGINGGNQCDGNGNCVECLANADCAAGRACLAGACTCELFAPPLTLTAQDAPISVAVADFDHASNDDIVVTNVGSASVSIFYNQGGSTFSNAHTKSVGSSPYSVAAIDCDGDVYPDLALVNYGSGGAGGAGTVSVLLNQGNDFPAASKYDAGYSLYSVVAAELDQATGQDGMPLGPDVAVANYAAGTVSVLHNTGNCVLDAPDVYHAAKDPMDMDPGPKSVTAADFDQDGWTDLAVADYDSAKVHLMRNLGDGQFGDFPFDDDHIGGPRFVVAADLNKDGWPDLAIARTGYSRIAVMLNDGTGNLGQADNYLVGAAPKSIAVADFNFDGWPDLAVANYDGNANIDGTISVLYNRGDGKLTDAISFGVAGVQPASVAVGDFDGDMRPDLAVANSGNPDVFGSVSVLLNICQP